MCSLLKISREIWAAHSVLLEAFALCPIDFGIFSKSLVFSLWHDKCCKAKEEGGGCASIKLNDTREHEASFIIVQKNNYACLFAPLCMQPIMLSFISLLRRKELLVLKEISACDLYEEWCLFFC